MNIHRPLRSAVLVLAAAAGHLAAADLQWGATVGLGVPALDVKDAVNNRPGLTLGAQATLSLGGGHAIRPRLDVARFRSGWISGPGMQGRNTIDTLKLGADYLYRFSGEAQGPYVFAGLGGVATRGTVDVRENGGGKDSESATVNKAYLQVGAGFQISRNWGVEAYHTRHKLYESLNYSASFLAVTARF